MKVNLPEVRVQVRKEKQKECISEQRQLHSPLIMKGKKRKLPRNE